ncbi:amidohydrolase family protein [Mycolicibacter senuensis]|uniref:Amidohydrolase n=1 Tax=Mycolicibacter senuensis TaxID=386913 RepID=A0A7I9XRA1_9MYCO|nr:amidohydrolase family protein [Mycolicibacter senuensis]MDQ2626427.1 amidohydrolase [Actinomycetota bacterium]ORW69710.1 amidohydrolase [Mycolicibacter senuensis]GFG71817.1 amidohydrolase [Mycolicibacter senuensis]
MTADDEAAAVQRIWSGLGLPGIIDVHTHFMPKPVMDKVWNYFDSAGPMVGRSWPITYRTDEAHRVETLRSFGVRRFTSLVYPHKPQMAAWLNQWSAEFARATPDCLATATFYPEPGAGDYVGAAVHAGAQLFKAHIQVGDYDPNDPLLDDVWGTISDSATPVVIHCGSGPQPGRFTGPEPVRRLLHRHPRLPLIVAHMGMPEYGEFLDICLDSAAVHLDTTMAFTAFVDELMPFPAGEQARLRDAGERIVFGSDFPNIPYRYRDALTAVTAVPGIDDGWMRGVLHDNAARLFEIALPSA